MMLHGQHVVFASACTACQSRQGCAGADVDGPVHLSVQGETLSGNGLGLVVPLQQDEDICIIVEVGRVAGGRSPRSALGSRDDVSEDLRRVGQLPLAAQDRAKQAHSTEGVWMVRAKGRLTDGERFPGRCLGLVGALCVTKEASETLKGDGQAGMGGAEVRAPQGDGLAQQRLGLVERAPVLEDEGEVFS